VTLSVIVLYLGQKKTQKSVYIEFIYKISEQSIYGV
jgi:hypothetical protein